MSKSNIDDFERKQMERDRDGSEIARIYEAAGPGIHEASPDEKLAVLKEMENALARLQGRYPAEVVKHDVNQAQESSRVHEFGQQVSYYERDNKPVVAIHGWALAAGRNFHASLYGLLIGQQMARAVSAIALDDLKNDSRFSQAFVDSGLNLDEAQLKSWRASIAQHEGMSKTEREACRHPLETEFEKEASGRMRVFRDLTLDTEIKRAAQKELERTAEDALREENEFKKELEGRQQLQEEIEVELLKAREEPEFISDMLSELHSELERD